MYFSGQGKLLVATRGSNGKPGVFRYVGNVPSLKVSLSVDKIQHHESVSGQRLLDFQMVKENKATIDFDLEEFSSENLALALYGTKLAKPSSPVTVTAEVLPTMALGDYARLDNPNVTAVVVTDSTPTTPLTPVLGTDYVVESGPHGTIHWIADPTPFVQPFNVSYSSAGADSVAFFSQAVPERWFRFEGLNTADTVNASKVLIEVYRVILDPMKELDLINDDLAKFAMSGSALYDQTAVLDASLGPFGRLMQL